MRNIKNILFCFILFCFVLTSCYYKSSDYYNSKAEKLEKDGKYNEAIIFLDKAIEKKPKNIYALINRGVDKSLIGDFKGAIEDYSRIIEIDESNTLAYFNRALNLKRLEDYKGAIEDLNKALESKRCGDTSIYFDMEKNPLINNEFDVKTVDIFFERGFANYYYGNLQNAFNDFNFCIQHFYNIPKSYYMLGLIYIAYGDFNIGCEMLKKSKNMGDLDAQKMIDLYCK